MIPGVDLETDDRSPATYMQVNTGNYTCLHYCYAE
jgi:hypothetical protein